MMPKPSVPPQPDGNHNPASMEVETAAVMRNSCVPTQRDGGYNPASRTASTAETTQHENVPPNESNLFNKAVQPKLDNDEAVDMRSYFCRVGI